MKKPLPLLLILFFITLSGCVTVNNVPPPSSPAPQASEPVPQSRLSAQAERALALCQDMQRRGLQVFCEVHEDQVDEQRFEQRRQVRGGQVRRQPARPVRTRVRDAVSGALSYAECRARGYDSYCDRRAREVAADMLLDNYDPQDQVVTFITNEGALTVIDDQFRRSDRNSIILARDVDVRQEHEVLLQLDIPEGRVIDFCQFRLAEINSRRARSAPPRDYVRVTVRGDRLYCRSR